MVQWLGLGTFTAMGMGTIPGQETKTPEAMWHSPLQKVPKVFLREIIRCITHWKRCYNFYNQLDTSVQTYVETYVETKCTGNSFKENTNI